MILLFETALDLSLGTTALEGTVNAVTISQLQHNRRMTANNGNGDNKDFMLKSFNDKANETIFKAGVHTIPFSISVPHNLGIERSVSTTSRRQTPTT